MEIVRMTQEVFWPDRGQYHVLTYAEEGFSPLNIHAEPAGLTKTEIVAFAAMVNERGEAGSLHPRARISAIPRTLIRDAPDKIELQNQIVSFFHANSTVIKATRIAFDFRTPRVQRYVVSAIEAVMRGSENSQIEVVAIIE